MWIFFLFDCLTFAQTTGGYAALSFGASIPKGDFASKNINQDPTAFATAGTKFELSIVYRPKTYFMGIAALLRNQVNPIDTRTMEIQFEQNYPGSSWNIKSDPWKVNLFMIGGYSPFPLGDSSRVSANFKFMIGAASCLLPEINATGNQKGTITYLKGVSATTISAAFLIGAGMKFNINSIICMLLDIDYLGTKPEFRSIVPTNNPGAAPLTRTLSQSISTFNVGVGIGFRLK